MSPLSSLKILDFSTLIPGPFATMVLADLGADVICIEAPQRHDAVRELPPPVGPDSAWHGVLGRSKRSLVLDLKRTGGAEVVRRLLATRDIVVEQFRPGVMQRLGLDYDTLRTVNAGIIYCSINSFGDDGPRRERAAHDVNALALAGALGVGGGWGHSAMAGAAARRAAAPTGPTPSPYPLGIQIVDLAAAMNAVAGILAAVIHRARTGEGQRVGASLYDTALMWNLLAASEVLTGAGEAHAGSGLLNGGSRYGVYETADGRHLALGGLEPALWERFCNAAERPDLHESPLAPVEPDLKEKVAALVRRRTLAEWTDLLDGTDACADPVLTVEEAIDHAESEAPHMLVDVGDGTTGQRQIANAIRLSATPPTYRRAGAAPAADRDEILADLGYSEADIEELATAGAFG